MRIRCTEDKKHADEGGNNSQKPDNLKVIRGFVQKYSDIFDLIPDD